MTSQNPESEPMFDPARGAETLEVAPAISAAQEIEIIDQYVRSATPEATSEQVTEATDEILLSGAVELEANADSMSDEITRLADLIAEEGAQEAEHSRPLEAGHENIITRFEEKGGDEFLTQAVANAYEHGDLDHATRIAGAIDSLTAASSLSGEQVEYVNSAEFDASGIVEALQANPELRDTSDLLRPSYKINGKEIVFRNRQEAPEFTDARIAVLGSVAPVNVSGDISSVQRYNESHPATVGSPIDRYVVTNTPLGLVEAAESITFDPTRRMQLQEIGRAMQEGHYDDPAASEVTDGILGSISIDNEGKTADYYDTAGFAVALAALAGNGDAEKIVAAKRAALVQNARAFDAAQAEKRAAVDPSYEASLDERGITAIAPEHISLVHSTSHAIERDEQGNIVLEPASHKRDDELPRASLHFTLNSQVASNMGGVWSEKNALIVAPIKPLLDRGDAPKVLNGVDTWFVKNPGEKLTLKDAVVVRPTSEGELFSGEAGSLRYLQSEAYSTEQSEQLDRLCEEYGIQSELIKTDADKAREIALHMALERTGVPRDVQDTPSEGGHYMHDSYIRDRMQRTGHALHLPGGLHSNYSESFFEHDVVGAMSRDYVKKSMGPAFYTDAYSTHRSTALAMRRQVVVSGYTPARPSTDGSIADPGIGFF